MASFTSGTSPEVQAYRERLALVAKHDRTGLSAKAALALFVAGDRAAQRESAVFNAVMSGACVANIGLRHIQEALQFALGLQYTATVRGLVDTGVRYCADDGRVSDMQLDPLIDALTQCGDIRLTLLWAATVSRWCSSEHTWTPLEAFMQRLPFVFSRTDAGGVLDALDDAYETRITYSDADKFTTRVWLLRAWFQSGGHDSKVRITDALRARGYYASTELVLMTSAYFGTAMCTLPDSPHVQHVNVCTLREQSLVEAAHGVTLKRLGYTYWVGSQMKVRVLFVTFVPRRGGGFQYVACVLPLLRVRFREPYKLWSVSDWALHDETCDGRECAAV